MAGCCDNVPLEPRLCYDPLSEGQIRLLTLSSAGRFDIITSSLHDSPEYSAVSYCWGKATASEVVQIGTHSVRLGCHVCSMLRTLFREHETVYIWIDTICINQSDLDEKSCQVSRMGLIYSRASKVFAWLGEANEDSDVVFDVLWEWDHRRAQAQTEPGLDAAEQLASDRDMFCEIYVARAGEQPARSADDDEMLHEEINWLKPLYSRDYWERTWIVQEAILARRLIICCGTKSIELERIYGLSLDWGSFEQGFGLGNHRQLKPSSKGWKTMQAICGHRRRRTNMSAGTETPPELYRYATLNEIIEIYAREHRCENPRDKVYAFCALNQQWENLVIKYEKSVLEVFSDAVQPGHFMTGPESAWLAAQLFSAMGLGTTDTFNRLAPSILRVGGKNSLDVKDSMLQ